MVVPTLTTPAKPSSHPVLIAVVSSLAAFMEVLDTTITNVSLTHIAGSLAASADESTWILTSYLVANGIVLPLAGWLSEVLGRKTFFMLCIAGFTAASFACGIATTLPMLIVFRLLQGIAGGGLQPMQQAIVMDAFPIEKRNIAFAITGITIVVAPILGPTLGGFITDNYNWRWVFFMNVPIGIIDLLLVNMFIEDPPHAEAKGAGKIDFIGLGLLALGLGSLQVVLDKGQEDDWFGSPFIVLFAGISAVCLIAGVFWLLTREDPIVDLRLMKDKYFGMSSVMLFFVGVMLYGAQTLLPLLLQSEFGYNATLAGLVLSPSGIAVIISMVIVGKLSAKIQARYLISFAMFSSALGMWVTMMYTPQTDYFTFVLMRIMQVATLPFMFVPIGLLAFYNVPKEKTGKASSLFSLMRNLGGSFGISLILTYVSRREQLHQTNLAQHLAPTDTVYQTAIAHATNAITSLGFPQARAMTLAAQQMYRHLIDQATMLAYADAFRIFGLMVGLLGFIALLLPRNEVGKRPAGGVAH